jgi:transposase
MQKPSDLSQSRIILKQDSTLIAVIEMSLSSWLVAGIVPGVERQPLKKLAVDESALLKLLSRWREEAEKAGRRIERIAVAFEAGRDGFWLARWLRARGIEAHVIHASSVAASREHRRAKTDRLDAELLKRAFLGWLRGERDHCKMVAIPTTKDEDAKRPNRERQSLVGEQTRIVNRMKAALIRLGIRGFNPKLKKAAGHLQDLRTPEESQYRPTRWLSCVATWSAGGSSVIRSAKSRRHAWSVWSRRPVMDHTRWSDCSPALLALVSKQRTCWCTRSSRGDCGIDEP